jgi:hypothetical protein
MGYYPPRLGPDAIVMFEQEFNETMKNILLLMAIMLTDWISLACRGKMVYGVTASMVRSLNAN